MIVGEVPRRRTRAAQQEVEIAAGTIGRSWSNWLCSVGWSAAPSRLWETWASAGAAARIAL